MSNCSECIPSIDIYSDNLCGESIKGKCVFYTGEALTDVTINSTMNSDQIIAALVSAIKILSNRIDALEA